MNIKERLAKKSRADASGCIIWTGRIMRGGYGHLNFNGRGWYVHRLAWTLANGSIPDGLKVCHRCDVPACINPDHLWLGTDAENVADRQEKGRQAKGAALGGHLRGATGLHARLSENQVREIRKARGTLRALAKTYGVSPSAISAIQLRKNWRHLED